MYREICENIKEIEGAIDLIEVDLRRYISTEKETFEYKYTKLLSHLITCWSEVRILKVANEKNAFTQTELNTIISTITLEGKWLKSLDIAICKAYRINISSDISSQLSFTARSRYNEIKNLIQNDLVASIEIRNRVAHGQWKFAFTNDLKQVSTPLTGKLRTENIVTLQLKKKILIGLASLIHDLCVSPPTFERDFDKHYRLIEANKRNIHKRKFADYKVKMIAKYKRGILKKESPTG